MDLKLGQGWLLWAFNISIKAKGCLRSQLLLYVSVAVCLSISEGHDLFLKALEMCQVPNITVAVAVCFWPLGIGL